MELRHLRYFIAAAEEQNISRAAARLHVSQPPLSRQIRDLEMELGVELFKRTAKSVRLTEAGRIFLDEARAVVRRADQAVSAVKAIGSGLAGELRVGYAPSLVVDILPRALRQCQTDAPSIRVALHDLSSEEMLRGLRDGTLDLALLIEQPPSAMRGLHVTILQRYPVGVAVSPTHPLARLKRCRFADLTRERLIGYSRHDYPEYLAFLRGLPWPKGHTPSIAEEHGSVTSLVAAVEAGRGVALAPESLACFAGPRLKMIPLQPQPASFIVIAAWSAGDPKIKQFVAAAQAKTVSD